jgi:light-regulated signal transduction histidine kinase (bacteriophytochrome)
MLKEIANVNEINFHNEIDENVFCRSENVTFYFTKLNFKCFTSHKTRRKNNVTAKANEDKLIIKVKDNGVGMSEKTTKNLLPHKWPLFLKQELKIRELESDYY